MAKKIDEEGATHADLAGREVLNRTDGRFFITAACAGAEVKTSFLDSLQTIKKSTRGQIRILPMRSHAQPLQAQNPVYDSVLTPYIEKGFTASQVVFNSNLMAMDLQLNPQMTNPLTGLKKIGRSSIILAHPVSAMTTIANSNRGLPRTIHTTGVCTLPDYQINRAGLMAKQAHQIGGLSVELDGSAFHIRELFSDKNGSIVDLGRRYMPNGESAFEEALSVVLGDIHAGQHDEQAMSAWEKLIKLVKPKFIVLHDLFNGQSINPHMYKNMFAQLGRNKYNDNLENELATTKRLLTRICNWLPSAKIIIVPSNHNDWIDRYLTQGYWVQDTVNYATAYRLVGHILNGHSALQKEIDPNGKCVWLKRNEDLWLAGIQHSCHFDLGPNGAKAGPDNLEATYGYATGGHVHSPYTLRGIMAVGTSSLLRMGYNDGPSGWLHSSIVTHASQSKNCVGLRQRITE